MTRQWAALCVGMVALTPLGACALTPISPHSMSGSASTPTSVESLFSDDRTLSGAPRVRVPLDTTGFEASPCSVLTTGQLTALAVVAPGKQGLKDPLGPLCDWTDSSTGVSFTGAFLVEGAHGLEALYSQAQQGELELFEPLPDLAGYPAVAYGRSDGRATGRCSVAVGLTDEATFTAAVTLDKARAKAEPCAVARQAVESAMATMTGGA